MAVKYLVFGSSGQVGSALGTQIEDDVVLLDRETADFEKPHTLKAIVDEMQPACIINAAAYTQVDKAEEEENRATIINADAPIALAEAAKAHDIPFVHYSTDYVFNGAGEEPRKEDAPTAPLNAYGRGKLASEEGIEAVGGKYIILRTSWVYDAWGKNFLNTMLKLGREREHLRIIADQIGAPSYAPHLAAATLELLTKTETMSAFPSGIYHMCNAGETSWYGFATAIFDEARERGQELIVKKIDPITTDEYPTPAARPHNSRLDCGKLQDIFGITMPDWQAGLHEAMDALTGGKHEAA